MYAYLKMEMPETCGECQFDVWSEDHEHFCVARPDVRSFDSSAIWRVKYCPLIELQPHGRLGDLDRLEQMFVDIDNAPYSGFDGTEPFYSAEDAAQIIRLAPTVIPASEEG